MRKKKTYDPEYYQANKDKFKLYAQRYKAKKEAIANGTHIPSETVRRPKTRHELNVERQARWQRHYEKRRRMYFEELEKQQTDIQQSYTTPST